MSCQKPKVSRNDTRDSINVGLPNARPIPSASIERFYFGKLSQ